MQIDSLSFLNAIIGFCGNDPSWPHPLGDMGFRAHFLEKEIEVTIGTSSETVTADLVMSSSVIHHALCVELKSRNVDIRQLRKYQAIRATDLFDQGLVDPQCTRTKLTHDVAYVSNVENARHLSRVLKGVLPLACGGEDYFQLESGEFTMAALHSLLENGIEVAGFEWPSSYVQLTSGPEHRMELLQSVLTALLNPLRRGEGFSTAQLLKDAIPHWEMCGRQELQTFRNSVRRIVKEAANTELNDYIGPGQSQDTWECKLGPTTHPSSIAKIWRLMRQHQGRQLNDLPYNPPKLGQRDIPEFRDI